MISVILDTAGQFEMQIIVENGSVEYAIQHRDIRLFDYGCLSRPLSTLSCNRPTLKESTIPTSQQMTSK